MVLQIIIHSVFTVINHSPPNDSALHVIKDRGMPVCEKSIAFSLHRGDYFQPSTPPKKIIFKQVQRPPHHSHPSPSRCIRTKKTAGSIPLPAYRSYITIAALYQFNHHLHDIRRRHALSRIPILHRPQRYIKPFRKRRLRKRISFTDFPYCHYFRPFRTYITSNTTSTAIKPMLTAT